ncbi:MAG: type III-B CRISPR-associated protein Cas10/Cmr2 [Cyanobacteria bacterium P01_F01_bin.33]
MVDQNRHQEDIQKDLQKDIQIAIAWCLAWGDQNQPRVNISILNQMRDGLRSKGSIPEEVSEYVEQSQTLDRLHYPETLDQLEQLTEDYPNLWASKIGLVYGGATKIKQYVFEESKLQDIRGASAILDRINLVDLRAFFKEVPKRNIFDQQFNHVQTWLLKYGTANGFDHLTDALIPELIIYSTGGNILAFCPPAYINVLANAIERRYTEETLTANSCAVGDTFRVLELKVGLLNDSIKQTNWLEWYKKNIDHDLVKAYFGDPKLASTDPLELFQNRKSFNELVGKLATRFNQRRSGHIWPNQTRPSRRYPPIFETHPYVRRDQGEQRSAVRQVDPLPGQPWLSDTSARKRIAGQKAKRDRQNTAWFDNQTDGQTHNQINNQKWFGDWNLGEFESWVSQFENFLKNTLKSNSKYRQHPDYQKLEEAHKEARSLREIGSASNGFVAYIYADGNNMGGYIQKIKSPEEYRRFSENVFKATQDCVYRALDAHLEPHRLSGIDDAEIQGRDGKYIHPFEILTIGGDDVILVVPANKGLAIAKTLCQEFERILLELDPDLEISAEDTKRPQTVHHVHRYCPDAAEPATCQLSMSAGVLLTAANTPIYYAENLTDQLLKSAKNRSKTLQQNKPEEPDYFYPGGTIDFLVMKSVTMLSSSIKDFRGSGLIFGEHPKPRLKLYGAPYTLHEIEGLVEVVKALKEVDFPRSQLYQIRSFLEHGKHTAILNYRYFWSRLTNKTAKNKLKEVFEDSWCAAQTNSGNLVPWRYVCASEEEKKKENYRPTYETIWRELIDLYPFINVDTNNENIVPEVQTRGEVT